MVDRTPSELPEGDASDTSVVHASQNDVSTDSRKHTERAISRLQSAIFEFQTNKTYEIGDLVWQEKNGIRVQYRCIKAIESGVQASGTAVLGGISTEQVIQIDPVNNGTEYTTPPVVTIGIPDVGTDQAFAISVLTGDAVTSYIMTNIGSGYTSVPSVQVASPDEFDLGDWEIADGIGAKNVVQVFTPDDFGPLISSYYQLSQETEYVICAKIDLGDSGLQLPRSAIVTFRTFNKEVNKIESTKSPIMIAATLQEDDITDVENSGTGGIRILTPDTHGLVDDNRVNIESDDYPLVNQTISNVIDDTSFEIVGPSFGMTDMGVWNNKPVKVEMTELEMEGDETNDGILLDFTSSGSTEFYAHHCDFEKLVTPVDLNGAELTIMTLCEFEESGTSIYREQCRNIIHTANSYFEPNSGTVFNLEILNNNTDAINAVISNNSFESNATKNAIHIEQVDKNVESVIITDGGSGYVSAPMVTIAAPVSGNQAMADATIDGGKVISVTITDGGSGYVSAPMVTIAAPVSGNQAMADANLGTNFPPDTRYLLTGNLDKNPTFMSLFETDDFGQDETDPNIIVRANGRQKDSKAFSDNNIQSVPSLALMTTINVIGQFEDIVDVAQGELWNTTDTERFSQTNVTNGEVTYTGLEDTVISIAYGGEYRTAVSLQNTCLAVFVDSGGGFAIVPDSQTYRQSTGVSSFTHTSRTKVFTVSNGDKIKLRLSNFDATTDISYYRTSMEISEV